jgi:sugar phosphate isomerase/epimerase
MRWGYALIWANQFLTRDSDPLLAKLKFLDHYGFATTGIHASELARLEPGHRDRVFAFLDEKNLGFTLIPGCDFCNPSLDEARRQVDEQCALVARFARPARAPISHMGVARLHRFLREPTLAWQMDRLATVLPPLVQACAEAGAPLSIENHGDYYCSDLVTLCRAVPGLHIFLDTGNTYLIGEQPVPAFEAAAPFVIGGHFKDHRVRPCPSASPLHFEIGPAVLGEGDVPLRECYDILRRSCPHFTNLAMEIELIPPSFSGNDPVVALEKSLAFCRSLEQGA